MRRARLVRSDSRRNGTLTDASLLGEVNAQLGSLSLSAASTGDGNQNRRVSTAHSVSLPLTIRYVRWLSERTTTAHGAVLWRPLFACVGASELLLYDSVPTSTSSWLQPVTAVSLAHVRIVGTSQCEVAGAQFPIVTLKLVSLSPPNVANVNGAGCGRGRRVTGRQRLDRAELRRRRVRQARSAQRRS